MTARERRIFFILGMAGTVICSAAAQNGGGDMLISGKFLKLRNLFLNFVSINGAIKKFCERSYCCRDRALAYNCKKVPTSLCKSALLFDLSFLIRVSTAPVEPEPEPQPVIEGDLLNLGGGMQVSTNQNQPTFDPFAQFGVV